jgi:hypothetical protein
MAVNPTPVKRQIIAFAAYITVTVTVVKIGIATSP